MTKIHGYGITLGYDLAGGTSYTTVGQLYDIAPPGMSRDAIDVTDHSSTDRWREFIKGLKDGGEVTLSVWYDPVNATQDFSTGVLADLDEDITVPNWLITFPDVASTTWTIPGFVTDASPAVPLDDGMSMDVTVKVSGKPTLA